MALSGGAHRHRLTGKVRDQHWCTKTLGFAAVDDEHFTTGVDAKADGIDIRHRSTETRLDDSAEACAASLLTGTNRIVGRCSASQIASASAMLFVCRFTNGFTYAGAISFTS